MTTPQTPPRPILARAGESGLVIGLYICALAVCTAFSPYSGIAVVLVWFGSLAMPFVLYRLIRKSNMSAGYSLGFPELWAEGIGTFFFGTLIPAAFVYAWLRFVSPEYISNTVAFTIQTLREVPDQQYADMANLLSDIYSKKMPTAADVTANLISFNIIVGTVMSLIVAVFVKTASIRRRMQRVPENNL